RPIAGGGNVPHERRGFERDPAARQRADDEQALSRAKVEADADGELAVLTQSSVEIARRHAVGTARVAATAGRNRIVKIDHARSIVSPAASTGAAGGYDASNEPAPMRGGSEFASAAMLEPMPRISP